MREILFRGKRVGNGKWIEGDLLSSGAYPDRLWITESKTFFDKQIQNIGIIEVDPVTVGQYTGLQDKNGKKIFEGDIVKVYNFEIIKKDGRHIKKQPFNLEVLFFNGGFVFSTKEDIAREFGLNANEYAISKTDKNCFRIEVVGNIYDNTKLIEDGTPLADRFWNIK